MLSLQLALWFAHIQHSDLPKQCSLVHQSQLFKWEKSYSFIYLGSLSASRSYEDEFSTKFSKTLMTTDDTLGTLARPQLKKKSAHIQAN